LRKKFFRKPDGNRRRLEGQNAYRSYHSYTGKTRVVLALLGIIPFTLLLYLVFDKRVELMDSVYVVFFSALALFSILAGFSLLRRSADQLVNLTKATSSLENGGKSEPIQIKADQELNDIATNFNFMLARLNEANHDIKEQSVQLMTYASDLAESYSRIKREEDIRNRLSRYIGEELVERLMNSPDGLPIENERQTVTILFADIRSFTVLAEKMTAEDVISMLNQYFTIMVNIIFDNNGILDKFVGDQLMAVFGIIPPSDESAGNAIKAALDMQRSTKNLMEERRRQNKETFEVGIGINTGSTIVGNVGSANRMDYTVIGDCVNVASRLEKIAGGGEIIIGEQTFRLVRNLFKTEKKGALKLRNKAEPVRCYNVVA